MDPINEKQFNAKSTYDIFDEIYTNHDLSVDDSYSAASGYPFDYPIRWLNDPSMNKRIAIRCLDVTPSSHNIKLTLTAKVDDELTTDDDVPEETYFTKSINVDITYMDNLIKGMNYICNEFSYKNRFGIAGLVFKHNNSTNRFLICFADSTSIKRPFQFEDNIDEFLRFLNQEISTENKDILMKESDEIKCLMKYGIATVYTFMHHSHHLDVISLVNVVISIKTWHFYIHHQMKQHST